MHNKAFNPSGERPLYLYISASSRESLDAAVARIRDLINQAQNSQPGQRPYGSGPPVYIVEKIPVDLVGDRYFILKPRLVGPGVEFLSHFYYYYQFIIIF